MRRPFRGLILGLLVGACGGDPPSTALDAAASEPDASLAADASRPPPTEVEIVALRAAGEVEITDDGARRRVRVYAVAADARTARIELSSLDTGDVVTTEPMALAAGTPAHAEVTIAARPGEGDPAFRIRAVDVEDGALLGEATGTVALAAPSVEASVERNYYAPPATGETAAAVFRVRATRVGGQLIGRMELRPMGGAAPLEVEAPLPLASRATVEMPLGDVPVGVHPVTLSVLDGEETLAQIEATLERRDPPPEGARATQIEPDRQAIVVDGEPLFPIGAVGIPAEQLEVAAEAGFNLTLRWRGESTRSKWDPTVEPEAQRGVVEEYLDAVHDAGLYAFEAPPKLSEHYFLYEDPDFEVESERFHRESLPGIVQIAGRHPATIGYYSYDEPDRSWEDGVRAFTETVHAHDPYHPVYALFSVAVQDWPGAYDIAGRDYYPELSTPLSEVHRYAAQSADSAREWRMPYIYMPLFETSSARPEPLSGPMQIAQTYLASIAGAKGILWWVWPASHQGNWAAVRQLSEEMSALASVWLAREASAEVGYADEATEDALKVTIRNHDGRAWLIMANSTAAPLDVEAHLPARFDGEAPLWFEDRAVAIAEGAASLSFEPYGRRVIELSSEWPAEARLSLAVDVGPDPEPPPPIRSTTSRNLVRNASVEREYAFAPGWPENWSPGSVSSPGVVGPADSVWSIDEANAWEGSRSLRLTRTEPGVATSEELIHHGAAPSAQADFPELPAGDYVASVYLRAADPGTIAWVFSGWEASERLEIGTDWQRVVVPFTLSRPERWHFLRVYLVEQGTLWIDGAQVEAGSSASDWVAD